MNTTSQILRFSQLSDSQQSMAIQALTQAILDELLVGTLIFPDETVQDVIDDIKVRYLMVRMTDEQITLLQEVRMLLQQAQADPSLRQSKSFKQALRALGQRPEARRHLLLLRQARPWQFYQLIEQATLTSPTGRTVPIYQELIVPLARRLALSDRAFYRVQPDGDVQIVWPSEVHR